MRLIECPERDCTAPAEVIQEENWPSTQGALVIARIEGTFAHRFPMPAWQLDLHRVYVLDETPATSSLLS